MDKVKRARKKALIQAIIFTVLLVAGIPMIPIGFVFAAKTTGAVHGILIAVASIGIAFTALGYFGTPLSWISFGNFAPIVRLLYAIEKECIYDVPTLATYLHRREKDIQGTDTHRDRQIVSGRILFRRDETDPQRKQEAEGQTDLHKMPQLRGLPAYPAGRRRIRHLQVLRLGFPHQIKNAQKKTAYQISRLFCRHPFCRCPRLRIRRRAFPQFCPRIAAQRLSERFLPSAYLSF